MNDASLTSQRLRVQSYLVLSALEQELARRLQKANFSLPETKREELEERYRRHGGDQRTADLGNLLSETYLEELIEFSIISARDLPQHELFKALATTCQAARIYEIRNACAHPNRPFPPVYWYRTATLAHEACIQQLNLTVVTDAVAAAEEGSITVPLEGITSEARDWLPRHNIGQSFDHTATGLVGRRREVAELRKAMKNPRHRLLALIGPPGVGKTALMLEVLYLAIRDAETIIWADAVVYVTLKEVELTANGSRPAGGVRAASLDELEVHIWRAVENSTGATLANRRGSDLRVLLCIDNLEGLLIHDPLTLSSLSDRLPVRWRVLASSQVPPDGAVNISVGPLDFVASRSLAREYARSRGLVQLTEEDLKRFAAVWDGNPLAIRLAVDAFNAGATLEIALTSSREQFLTQAYGAMIDLLPSDGRDILECLFTIDEQATASRCAILLERDLSRVQAALVLLARTSLVQRLSGGAGDGGVSSEFDDQYALLAPIRMLLLRKPANEAARAGVRERLKAVTAADRAAAAAATGPLDDDTTRWDYIPPNTPADIRLVATESFALAANAGDTNVVRVEAVRLLEWIDRDRSNRGDSALLARCRAHLLRVAGDSVGAARWLISLAAKDSSLDDALRVAVSSVLSKESGSERVAELLASLYAREVSRPTATLKSVRRIADPYLGALARLPCPDQLLAATSNWKDVRVGRAVIVAPRLTFWIKRCVEFEKDQSSARHLLNKEILPTLDDAINVEGYSPDLVPVMGNALRICRHLARNAPKGGEFMRGTIQFFNTHLRGMIGNSESSRENESFLRRVIVDFAGLPCVGNPFREKHWQYVLNGKGDAANLLRQGFERTELLRPWRGQGRVQLFTRGPDNTIFFVTGESLITIEGRTLKRPEVMQLTAGELIYLLPDWTRGRVVDETIGQPVRRAVVGVRANVRQT